MARIGGAMDQLVCRLLGWEGWEVRYDLPNTCGFSVRMMRQDWGEWSKFGMVDKVKWKHVHQDKGGKVPL